MKLLINFSSLKKGGGQNVAMNFLYHIESNSYDGVEFYFWVAEDSEPHRFLKSNGFRNFLVLPQNPFLRILFEATYCRFWIKKFNVDVVYSYFGYSFLSLNTKQISGSADSNLYYPEIDFWSDCSGIRLLMKKLIDWYRVFGLRRSSHVVFENNDMLERSKSMYNFKSVSFIKPSIAVDKKIKNVQCRELNDKNLSCLFLCGWHANKNVILIPRIIKAFRDIGINIHVYFSASYDNSKISKEFEKLVLELGVQDSVIMIGTQRKEQLPDLFNKVDFVFLLSKLESFSNNIIESWFFKRPLVISDETWSRSICKDAAIYVDRESPEKIANEIFDFINNPERQRLLHAAADAELSTYPSIAERVSMEISLAKKVHNNV